MLSRFLARCDRWREWITGPSTDPVPDRLGPRNRMPSVLFGLCIALYAVYLVLVQGRWVLGGGMWAEMAENYYPNSISASLGTKLFATDYGYLPLPQRLIGLVGDSLHLPAAAIPYFYTWSAIILTGAMVGTFCLRPFRALIRSDFLRFFVALSVLMVVDFETRSFINFTYFVAFYAAVFAALAFVDDVNESPWYAWFIPLLLVSKPAVLVVIPAMLVACLVSKRRFRWVTAVSLLAVILQAVVLALNKSQAQNANTLQFSFFERITSGIEHAIEFVGSLLIGKSATGILFGLVVLLLCLVVLLRFRSPSSALILVGLSLVGLNILLNAFALSDMWNPSMAGIPGVLMYRHVVVSFFGIVLVVAGVISALLEEPRVTSARVAAIAAPGLFLVWFIGSGWYATAGDVNRVPGLPVSGSSQWQQMSDAIDGDQPVCVPVDPLGWVFGRGCELLNKAPLATMNPGTPNASDVARGEQVVVRTPPGVSGRTVRSVAVVVRPATTATQSVMATATFKLKDGQTRTMAGSRLVDAGGGLVMMTGHEVVRGDQISSVVLVFDTPVAPFGANEQGSGPTMLWMGI